MKTKTKVIKKEVKEDYRRELFTRNAGLSGVAIKVSTAKADGIYPVVSKTTGTGIITRILLASALKASKKAIDKTVPASEISEAYKRLEADAFKSPLGILYEKEIGKLDKPFGNYKTLKSRLKTSIESGGILGFAFKDSEDSEVKRIFASVK